MRASVKRSSKDFAIDEDRSRSESSSSGSSDTSDESISTQKCHGGVERRKALASKETRAVWHLKILVFAVLTLSLIGVAYTAYSVTGKQEQDQFTMQYYRDTAKVVSAIGHNLHQTLQAADYFAASMVSVTNRTNQTWPFVVIPDFAVQAEKVRSISQAVLVNLYQVVDVDQREEWETFTAKTGKGWVDESIAAIENYGGMDWPIVWNYTLWDVIHGYDEFDKENPGVDGINTTGPWIPMWQTQPTLAHEPPYNWDLRSKPLTQSMNVLAPDHVIDKHKPVITEAYLISYPDDLARIEEDLEDADWIAEYLPAGEEPMEPVSDIFYPIMDNAHEQMGLKYDDNNMEKHKVMALFSLTVYWRDTIRNILPVGSNGIRIVFENPCNPTFTYEINGPGVLFLGAGDIHDVKYDDMAVKVRLTELKVKHSTYTGLPLIEDFCPFNITLYPTDERQDAHTTNTPAYFALVVILIFIVTAATFVMYDFFVERRQQVVLMTAVKASALVASLFPDLVRDQVLPVSKSEEFQLNNSNPKGNNKSKAFLNDGRKNDNRFLDHGETQVQPPEKPIAELFPDTTVFCCDIAGFTAWSAARSPCDVFTLLETLYGAFDGAARQHTVFKVETIGDSYIAVCGLPQPRKNHATVAARFALKCMDIMGETTKELEHSLGRGTRDLSLRVGLHSGPTIAGVLRGEKARFQLFGETVNTAGRMEHTSLPNKIQVSDRTAALLIEDGKGHWLVPRDSPVNVNGDIKLQTYFLDRKKKVSTTILSSTLPSGSHKSSTLSSKSVIE